MVVAKDNQIKEDGVYRIRDTINILITLIVTVAIGIFTLLININYTHFILLLKLDDVIERTIFQIVVNFIFFGASYRLKAVWDGVKLDLNQRTIEFGGGGVDANDMSDYLKLDYLLQYFKRTSISLDDVSNMGMETITNTTYIQATKSYRTTTKHIIRLSGTFGAATIPFASEGKCNELYTAIRQINRMGSPIVFS